MKQKVFICLFLVAIVWLVFGQTTHHEFINYDDDSYVYENPVVTGGLSWPATTWVFTHSLEKDHNWLPVTMLSHMLDCQLYGLKPGGHHLTNVLIHALTVVLLFGFLQRFTGEIWRSAFVAAVFAIHPLRVESVAWIAERKDVLSGLFFVLTLWAYAEYVKLVKRPNAGPNAAAKNQRLAWYVAALLAAAVGLLCKPMLVTLPFVLLLLDYWPLGRIGRFNQIKARVLLDKLPFLLLSVAVSIVTLKTLNPLTAAVQSLSVSWRLENAVLAGVDYLGQLFYPVNLAVFYPLPGIRPAAGLVVLSLLVLLTVSLAAVMGVRRYPWLLIGWFWFLGMLTPVIGLVQVGAQSHADRYTYLPEIGLCLAVIWGVTEIFSTWRYRRLLLGFGGALVLGILMRIAYVQTGYWQDSITLWTHTLACTSGNWVAHENLGNALFRQKQLAGAIDNYNQASLLKPGDAQPHYDLGIALAAEGNLAQAMEQEQLALELQPDFADAHVNLGTLLARQGNLDDAIGHFRRALEINPGHVKALVNLANALASRGQWEEAVEHYRQAIQIKPDYTLAYVNLGSALAGHGKMDEAIPCFQKAQALATAQGNLPLAENLRNRLMFMAPALPAAAAP
jgi:tetratricopeptide (TPR) repeat protein